MKSGSYVVERPSTAPEPAAAEPQEWKRIGSISGTDEITHIHITNLLLAHGIQSGMQGSRCHEILVPAAKAEEAASLLRVDAAKGGYAIWFAEDDVVTSAELKLRVKRTTVSDLLKQPDYASNTALGRFLRSTDIARFTAKYPYIVSFSVHERQYLATTDTYRTGYDIKIELRRSPRLREDGCNGRCQVYGDGSPVSHIHFGEWAVGDK